MQKNKTAGMNPISKSKIALWLCILLMIILPVFSRISSAKVRESLTLCYTTVIPAVFPFMVLSSFLIKLNGHSALGNFFALPFRFLFGTSPAASCPVALGLICGYPIGASTAASLYDKGEISKKELERLLTFVNNPSPAFVIGGVGLGLFGSAKLGRLIYLSVLLSAALCGIATRLIYPKDRSKSSGGRAVDLISLPASLTSALSESAIGMLNVCACVLFFSVPGAMIGDILSRLGATHILKAAVSGFLEISGGVKSASELTSPMIALMMSAFCCSWSGLSVHMQIFSVCRGRGVSFNGYLISKLIQSFISPGILYILLRVNSADIVMGELVTPTLAADPRLQLPILILFCLSVLLSVFHRLHHSVI